MIAPMPLLTLRDDSRRKATADREATADCPTADWKTATADGHSVPPATIRGNDWRSLPVAPLESFKPFLTVTVVVTYYEAPEALELTLAAIECQTYPRDLFEVVIVDDGSREPLAEPDDSTITVRVVHQDDRGFGLARARNTGACAAAGDVLVFLDCDMIPEADWLAEHARWHHAASDVITLGSRRHVEVHGITPHAVRFRSGSLADLFAGRKSDRPEWIEGHMIRTDDLTSDHDDIFRPVTGGNLGVSRAFYELIGAYDETFTQWGAEDTEFGYRAYTRGAVLVPARGALCWHQGEGSAPTAEERLSLELQRAKIAHLIAHPGYRRSTPGRSFTVPEFVVTITPGDANGQELFSLANQILASEVHDLVVWINERENPGPTVSGTVPVDVSSSPDAWRQAVDQDEWLRRMLGGDPRVRFGPVGEAADAFPAASFHVTIPAGTKMTTRTIGQLRKYLGSAAAARATMEDGTSVDIVRAWAHHRAGRTGQDLADLGRTMSVDGSSIGVHSSRPRPAGHAKRTMIRRPRSAGSAQRTASHTDNTATTPSVLRWGLVGLVHGSHRIRATVRRSIRIGIRICQELQNIHRPGDARQFFVWAVVRTYAVIFRRLYIQLRRLRWPLRRLRHLLHRRLRRLRWPLRRLRHLLHRRLRRLRWPLRRLRHLLHRRLRRLRWPLRRLRHLLHRRLRRLRWPLRRLRHLLHRRLRRLRHFLRSRLRWPLRRLLNCIPGMSVVYSLLWPKLRVPNPFDDNWPIPLLAARGHRSQAVLAASGRVTRRMDPSVQAVIADTPTQAANLKTDAPRVLLSELDPTASVSAFDPCEFNPEGWELECEQPAVTLDSVHRTLPGVFADRAMTPTRALRQWEKLRRAHHVEYTAGWNDRPEAWAGALAALAATGAIIHLKDSTPEAAAYLGWELHDLMTDPRIPDADTHLRELISIAIRRAALRDHSLRARTRQLLDGTDIGTPTLPTVSVLLATRRPERLARAVAAVASQTYPRIELVLAPHGDGFSQAEIDSALRGFPHPIEVLPVSGDKPLGTVLKVATAIAAGSLITKFDDDDIYGTEHLWDLVLAYEYSRAELVGKAAEFVYLAGHDRTLRRFSGWGERHSRHSILGRRCTLAGGAMMISRHVIEAVGGWQPIPAGVDQALIWSVQANNGMLYRTHGNGYMLVRHGGDHTWTAEDDYFLGQADQIREGCDLAFAGIGSP